MYAIIETGGKQYKVTKGDLIEVECLGVDPGETLEIPNIKLFIDDKNTPHSPTKKSKVIAKVIKAEVKGKKIVVFRFRRRKDSHTKHGHRQKYSLIKIENIQR